MSRLLRVIVPVLLVVTVLVSSGCTSGQTSTLTKVIKIAVTDLPCVAEAVYDGGTVFDRNASGLEKAIAAFSILAECVPDGIHTYNIVVSDNPSIALPATTPPHVDVEYELEPDGSHVEHTYPAGNPLQLTTNAVSNCSSASATADITVTVPFKIFMQSDGDASPLTYDKTRLDGLGKGTGTQAASDSNLIAQQLYSDTQTAPFPLIMLAGRFLGFKTQPVPKRTTESFAVTYTVTYRKGGALVSRLGTPGTVYAWLYVDSLTITSISQTHVHPVTAAECP